ncbi:MAG: MMPL family transporter [Gammaproteobacteria bacterium]|nr:MMPL family transporter [Gammaproteobacteria bacterium]
MSEWIAAFVLRRRILLPVLIVLLTAAAAIPASRVSFDNSIEIWFLEADPALELYGRFSELFRADDITMVGVFADNVFDIAVLTAIDRISSGLSEHPQVMRVQSLTHSAYSERAEGGFRSAGFRQDVLASPAAVGNLVSADARATAVVVHYSRNAAAAARRYEFVDELRSLVEREMQDLPAEFAISGAAAMGRAGQLKNKSDLAKFVPFMFLVIVLTAWLVFGTFWLALLPLAVVGVSVVSSFAVMGLLGWHMTMISAMLMPLILAIGVADTVHVIARVTAKFNANSERTEAIRSSLVQLLRPCFFTTVTTVTALLALLVSNIGPVRQFGIIGAVGVAVAFIVSIALLPSLLMVVPLHRQGRGLRCQAAIDRCVGLLQGWSGRFPGAIVTTSLLLLLCSAWMAARIPVGLDPLTWFPAGDPFRVATERVDRAFGGSLALEFLVTAPTGELKKPATLRQLEEFESWLLRNTAVARVFSLVDVVKEAARLSRDEGPERNALPRSQAVTDALLGSLWRSGELRHWVSAGYDSARISARIPVDSAQQFVNQAPAIDTYIQTTYGAHDIDIEMTGHAVLVGRMQDYVISSQVASFSVALIAVSVLMFALLKSITLGALAVLGNLLPIAVGLAAMTLFGISLNPGSVMITAVALGIVVDDSIHLMTAMQRQVAATRDITPGVVNNAISEVGRPIVTTSIVLAAGFAVLLLGGFLPSRQIGGVTALIIVCALLADLLFIPAAIRLRLPARQI